ncbi:MAG: glycosyltransferase family 4 protein [Acidobacteriota bacterium]|nr:MAG: glycosyltransferase family 4 protein [Acidobacteriota bacterium]
MNRIWVVGEPYAPEENTTAYYLTQTAEGLARRTDVAVLCGQPSYLSRGVRAPNSEELNGVDVRRCRGTTLDKNVLLFRLTNMLTLGTSMFLNALFRFRKTDKVLVVSAPPSLPYLIALVCRFRGVPYYFLLHDKYPEILVATGNIREGSFLVKLIRRLNRWLYSGAAKIIAVGRDMEEAVADEPGADRERIVTIQNWASLEEVSPTDRSENALLKELGLLDKFVVLYAGNMGPPQDIESIVEAAGELKKRGKEDVHFLFVGAGGKKARLEKQKEELGFDNITIVGPRPRSDQTNFLNACDVAIVTLVEGMKALAMPSRTYNFLAAGKPIIAIVEEGSETAIVVEEEDCGWIVPPHDAEALLEAIVDASTRRDELAGMGARARRAAETKYSFETALAKYSDLFELEDD